MPKLKTHKGAAKRFKKTGTGKIKRHKAVFRHILTSKAKKRKKKLGNSAVGKRRGFQKSEAHDPVLKGMERRAFPPAHNEFATTKSAEQNATAAAREEVGLQKSRFLRETW